MFEMMIAYRYLRRGSGFVSLISGFSFAGIAIGVAALIVVMAVMNGYHDKLSRHIIGVGGHLRVVDVSGGYIAGYSALMEQISNVEGVSIVTPVQNEEVVIMSEHRAGGAYLSGVPESTIAKDRPMVAESVVNGSLASIADGVIAIGSELARSLGVRIGDTVTIISPKFFASIVGEMPNMKDYYIGAIFEVGMFEYDSTAIYMSLYDANNLFDLAHDSATNLDIYVNKLDRVDDIARNIASLLPIHLKTMTWADSTSELMYALKVERVVMFLILTLIVVVAAFNIISGLVILAQDRKHEVAILKTIGASNGSILAIFVICGANIGMLGTLLGVGLGTLFAANIDGIRTILERYTENVLFSPVIYFFSELPSVMVWQDVMWVGVMSFGLSLLASVVPAAKIAQYNPSTLLRGA